MTWSFLGLVHQVERFTAINPPLGPVFISDYHHPPHGSLAISPADYHRSLLHGPLWLFHQLSTIESLQHGPLWLFHQESNYQRPPRGPCPGYFITCSNSPVHHQRPPQCSPKLTRCSTANAMAGSATQPSLSVHIRRDKVDQSQETDPFLSGAK